MKILYFAWVREAVGHSEDRVDVPAEVTTAEALIDWLAQQSPGHAAALADKSRLRIALDQIHAPLNAPLGHAREVAIFPPVTGGTANIVRVQAEAFDAGRELARLSGGAQSGAVVSFIGQVRRHNDGAPIEALTLEHYPGMTEAALSALVAQARTRWPLQAVTLIHRYGRLQPGDPIVFVAAAAAHRRAAFEAVDFLMDRLKTEAPFWKQEATPSGRRWVAARQSDDEAAARWQERA